MAKWYLFWILTIQEPGNQIKEREPVYEIKDTKTECLYEAKAKMEELETHLGTQKGTTEWYKTRVKYGGELIGIVIGCKIKNGG